MPVSKRRNGPKPAPAVARDWQTPFLDALAEGMTYRQACLRAAVGSRTPEKAAAAHPEFKAAWREAAGIGTERLEEEAQRRAYHGVERPILYKGTVVTHVQEYSDALLALLLKARKPHVYRDQSRSEVSNVSLAVNVQAAAVVRAALGQPDSPAPRSVPALETGTPSAPQPIPDSPPIEVFDPCW